MKWITREHPRVDRVACPWLIEKFVDQNAEFIYVPTDQVESEAAKRGYGLPKDVLHRVHVAGESAAFTAQRIQEHLFASRAAIRIDPQRRR